MTKKGRNFRPVISSKDLLIRYIKDQGAHIVYFEEVQTFVICSTMLVPPVPSYYVHIVKT
jgi:hypothetical protein